MAIAGPTRIRRDEQRPARSFEGSDRPPYGQTTATRCTAVRARPYPRRQTNDGPRRDDNRDRAPYPDRRDESAHDALLFRRRPAREQPDHRDAMQRRPALPTRAGAQKTAPRSDAGPRRGGTGARPARRNEGEGPVWYPKPKPAWRPRGAPPSTGRGRPTNPRGGASGRGRPAGARAAETDRGGRRAEGAPSDASGPRASRRPAGRPVAHAAVQAATAPNGRPVAAAGMVTAGRPAMRAGLVADRDL